MYLIFLNIFVKERNKKETSKIRLLKNFFDLYKFISIFYLILFVKNIPHAGIICWNF